MELALTLARQGLYSASPNPRVGCVLVKERKKIGVGYHRRAGDPHAEIEALTNAQGDTRGATAYVSLEPCNHTGRTPPCSQALIDAGVMRVVYAISDPNTKVLGGGATRLRAAGIDVLGGVCRDQAAELNRGYFMRFEQGRPFVRVKIAMSLDGCSALESGESQWITGREARLDVHRLRAESCAVATGIGTVLADDPLLNVRHEEIVMYGRQPMRVVLDSQLRMPPDARMLAVEGQTLIFQADSKVDRDLVDALIRPGVRVERVGGLAGHVDIISLLDRLAQLEVNELLVEAGPALAGAFMTGNHCDELIVYIAPKILGSTARRAFDVPSPSTLLNSKIWKTFSIDQLGEDLKLVLKSKNSFADK